MSETARIDVEIATHATGDGATKTVSELKKLSALQKLAQEPNPFKPGEAGNALFARANAIADAASKRFDTTAAAEQTKAVNKYWSAFKEHGKEGFDKLKEHSGEAFAKIKEVGKALVETGAEWLEVGSLMAGVVGPVLAFAKGVQYASKYETNQVGFQGILGSKKLAAEQMRANMEWQEKSPWTEDAANRLARSLLLAKVPEGAPLKKAMEGLGNVIATMGGSQSDLLTAASSFQTMGIMRRLDPRMLRSLAYLGIDAEGAISKALHTTPEALRAVGSSQAGGEALFRQIGGVAGVIKALAVGKGGGMDRLSNTFEGRRTQAAETASTLMRLMATPFMPGLTKGLVFIKGWMEETGKKFGDWISKNRKTFEGAGHAIGIIANQLGKVFGPVLKLTVGLFGALVLGAASVLNWLGKHPALLRTLTTLFTLFLTPVQFAVVVFAKLIDMLGGVGKALSKLAHFKPPAWLIGLVGVVNPIAGGALLAKRLIGDSSTPQMLPHSAAFHSSIAVPGQRIITSGYRTNNLGSANSGHLYGDYDLIGSGLGAYAAAVNGAGGSASMHGGHLHVRPPMGDSSTPFRSTSSGGIVVNNWFTIKDAVDIGQTVKRIIVSTTQDAVERSLVGAKH